MRGIVIGAALVLLAGVVLAAPADDPKAEGEGKSLFNGKDLHGWELRPARDGADSKWRVAQEVTLMPSMAQRFDVKAGHGLLVNAADGLGVDLITADKYGDCEVHVEFCVPKRSNSGVYFEGQYELQILSETYGKKDKDLAPSDCGGIYTTAAPKKNACKKPGEWQTYDVTFHAPRFDKKGKKTANANFVKVVFNGEIIHENVEVKGPTTAALGGKETPTGPLMLQGDHGPVAFRNIRLKSLAAEK